MEAIDKVGGAVAKIRGGLEDLGIVSEETAEKLRKIEGAADLIVGSSQIAVVSMEAWTRATKNQRTAMIGLAAAAAAVSFAVAAANTENEDAKKVYSALTGVTAGLAAAEFTLAAAKAAQWTAASGPLAPVTAAAIAAGLVGVSAAIATYIASSEKAQSTLGLQTGAGVIKEAEVLSSGQIASGISVDAGEVVSVRAARPNVAESILRERTTGGPMIREMNVTIIGAFNPWNPAENRKAAEVMGENIIRRLGGRVK